VKRIYKILILAAVLCAVAVGGYFYYKSGVAYAALSINSAVKNRDWGKFAEFVDVDAVYESVMTRLVGESDFARDISAAMKGAMVEGLRKAIIEEKPSGGNSGGISVGDIYGLLKIIKKSSKGGFVMVNIPLEAKDLNIKTPNNVEVPDVKINITLTFKRGNGHLVLCGVGTDLNNEDIMALGEAMLGASLKGVF